MSEQEISFLRDENDKLKAQIESIKGWLRSIPEEWIDIENTTLIKQQMMLKDMKEWLLRIPMDLSTELGQKSFDDMVNENLLLTKGELQDHEMEPLIKIEEKEIDTGLLSCKTEKETDPLLLALDLKEEVDEELLSKENCKAEPTKKRKKKVRAPYKTPPRTTCDICQKSVTRIGEHMETHNEQRNKFKCEVCNKDLVTALGFKNHMKLHTGEGIHLCTMCGKSFTASANLAKHMEIHLDEKKYVCNLCGKGFNTSCDLTGHMNSHSTEWNHECKECGKMFKSAQHLRRHVRANHTEQSLVCSYCQKTFKYSKSLRVHIMTHTGEKPHKCTVCDKPFCQQNQLKRHMLIHEGVKPHKCPLCGKGFNQISNMRTHLKTHDSK